MENKQIDRFSETPEEDIRPLIQSLRKSDIFGPRDYLEGKSNEEILLIAKPLLENIELGIPCKTDTNIMCAFKKTDLDDIKKLNLKGKGHIINWLYYHSEEAREKLLNT
jgi:hypothetical protein